MRSLSGSPSFRSCGRAAIVPSAARHLRAADCLRLAPPDRAAHPARPPAGGARRAWSPPWCVLRSARAAGSVVPRASCPSPKRHRERGQAPRPSAPGVAPAVRLRRALSRPPSPSTLAATPPGQGRCAPPVAVPTLDRARPRPPCPRQRATRRWLHTVGRTTGRPGHPRGRVVRPVGHDRVRARSGPPPVGVGLFPDRERVPSRALRREGGGSP